jgi:hypothetical protein
MAVTTDKIMISIAGEFLVAGELSKRGWISTLTAKNTPDIDVLASRPDGLTVARVQVKTRSNAYRYAQRVARIRHTGPTDFVVFVELGEEDQSPRYFVIPAAEAAAMITEHKQVRTRDMAPYDGRWDLLDGTGATA